ncbi:MAG: hypothetical protein ACTS5Y_10250, partial [Pollutimonas bauzanensis]
VDAGDVSEVVLGQVLTANQGMNPARQASRAARAIMWLFFLLVLGNMASTMLECGFGSCPDNPASYLWLS